LAAAIVKVAANIHKFYFHPWHQDPFGFAVLKAAVDFLLTSHRPKGDSVPNLPSASYAELLWGPDHAPENVARTFVIEALRGKIPGVKDDA